MGRRKEIVLTEYQRQFAVEHYGLLLKFMGRHGLGDEEYGLFAERFLRTVATYTSNQELQNKYAFSTILWYRLWAELGRERRRKGRRAQYEMSLEDTSMQPSLEYNSDTAFLWHAWRKFLTEEQIVILQLKVMGYCNKEIGKRLSQPSREIGQKLNAIRDLIKNSGTL